MDKIQANARTDTSLKTSSTNDVKTSTQSLDSVTEINDENPNCQICDVQATFKHIARLKKRIPREDFEKLVSNVTCYKFKSMPRYFILKYKKKLNIKERCMRVTKERDLKFDWIRQKRSLSDEKFSETDSYISDILTKIYEDKLFDKSNSMNDDDNESINSESIIKINQTAKAVDKITNSKIIQKDDAIFTGDETKPDSNLNNVNNELNTPFDDEDTRKGNTKTRLRLDREKPFKTQTISEITETSHEVHNKKQCGVKIDFVTERDDFETFAKGKFGIYERRKRSLDDVADLSTNIQNWPLQSNPKETYAMLGDSVIVQCSVDNTNETNITDWNTGRKDMLIYDNVILDGSRVYIKGVGARNQGEYICKRGRHVPKSLNVTVITLPTFDIVFAPVYSVDKECSYEDLRTIQPIEAIISRECCPRNQICTVSVQDPICLSDRMDGTANLRMTLVLSVAPRKGVACSARCRRDLLASMALLVARNAPALASVPVLISNEYFNKTLTPLMPRKARRLIITHTLRKKDFRSKRHVISNPDGVNIYMVCPAGYYLLSEQRICAACPSGSWSKEGDNVCQVCPRGTRSIPGEDSCHLLVKRVRRFDSAWCGVCAACVAGWALACAAAARAGRAKPASTGAHDVPKVCVRAQCRARPLSPSRVVLAKFFRGSRSSTRATGSQETKFGLWKERNNPPPLPPIDFDF